MKIRRQQSEEATMSLTRFIQQALRIHGATESRSPRTSLFQYQRRWDLLATAFFVGLVPALPSLVLAYVTDHTLGFTAFFLCLLFLGLGVSLRERPTWIRRIAVLYWTLVILTLIPFAIFGFQTAPEYFLIAMALALAVFLPISWRRLGDWILVSSAAILGIAAAWELWDRSQLVSLLTAGFTIVIFILIAYLARRGTFYYVNRIAIALCVFTSLVHTKGFLVYKIHKPLAIDRILKQPGIRAIYDYRRAPFDREIPPQAMFFSRVPGHDLFVIGPHDPYHEVLLIQPEESSPILRIPIHGRGGDQALFHEDEPAVFVMAGRCQLYRLSVDPPRIIDELNLGEKKLPLSMIRYDSKYKRYIVIRGYHPDVYLVDRRTFHLLKTLKTPSGSVCTDGWVDLKNNFLILIGNYLVGGQLLVYDLDTLDLRKEVRLPWTPVTLGSVDEQGRRLYLASLLLDKILIFNLDTLEVVGDLDFELGIRNLNFDPERRWLIIGNFFSGHLLIYDVDGGIPIGKLFLGKLVRWVEVDQKNHKWYANSSSGGFEIAPDLALSSSHFNTER